MFSVCGPPPTAYAPKLLDSGGGVAIFSKGERFKENTNMDAPVWTFYIIIHLSRVAGFWLCGEGYPGRTENYFFILVDTISITILCGLNWIQYLKKCKINHNFFFFNSTTKLTYLLHFNLMQGKKPDHSKCNKQIDDLENQLRLITLERNQLFALHRKSKSKTAK